MDEDRVTIDLGEGRARRHAPRLAWRGAVTVAVVVPLGFYAVFFAWPVGNVVARGLREGSSLGASLRRSSAGPTAWFTFWQAAASTVLTLAVGLPAAWAVARRAFAGRALARAVLLAPFVLPTVVVGAALNAAFDRLGLDTGPVHLPHTVWAVLVAHLVFNVAVVVRVVGGRWALLDTRAVEAARALGASPWRALREVTLPALVPAIRAASAIVFLFCFTSFGVILTVGSPTRPTLETEIWRYATQRTDFSTAAALAVVQLGAVVALLAVTTVAERRISTTARISRLAPPARSRTWRDRAALGAALGPALVLVVVPLASLVERSLRVGDGYGLANYRSLLHGDPRTRSALLVAPIEAVRNSVVVATCATLLAVVVGGLAALVVVYGRSWLRLGIDIGMMVPLGTSAVTLGFGILVTLDEPPLDLRTSWWIVPVAQALVGTPFVMRAVIPVLRAVDPRTREAAAVLGAPPWRVRAEVDAPLASRALLVGAAFAFAVSLGEFGATSFLARPAAPTVPVVIFRLLGLPGSARTGQAMALSVVLAVLTVGAVAAIERLRPRGASTLV